MFIHTKQVLQSRLRAMGLTIAAVVIASCAACGGGGGGGGGGASAAGATTFASTGPSINLNLSATRVTGVAPLGVSFNTVGTTAAVTTRPFHDLRYTWNFGDATGATWAYGVRPGIASKNAASGPVAAHVFEFPGIYTVTLTAFDGINTSSKTTTITVLDPNVAFASNTIYISQSGVPVPGADGVPMGANVQQVSNWTTVASLAQTYKRIFLKRGDTWSTNGTAGFGAAQVGPGIIAAYGTGNRPKVSMDVNSNAITFSYGANDWRLVDVEITSNDLTYKNNADAVNASANNILILRSALSKGRVLLGGSNASGLYVVDSVIGPSTSLGYGICGYTDKIDNIALLGNRITGSGDHGFRIQGTTGSVVSNNQVDTPKPTAHVFTLRGKANDANVAVWNGQWSENNVISDNLFDGSAGSAAVLKVAPQANGHAERLRNIIVERNFIKGNNVLAITTSVAENLTFRNNISVTYGQNAVSVGSDPGLFSPAPSSGFFYNNTFYKPNTTLSNGYSVMELSGAPTGLVFKNNIGYAPGNTRDGATNGVGATFLNAGVVSSMSYLSQNNSSDLQINSSKPWSAIAPANAADFTPAGYAASSGVIVSIWDDFMTNFRVIPRSLGALNP